jgi:hypothetical protein
MSAAAPTDAEFAEFKKAKERKEQNALKKTRYIIVCPVEGAPYLLAAVNKQHDSLGDSITEGVGGYFELLSSRNHVKFHPGFTRANPRWALAERLRTYQHTRVWVNEDGRRKGLPPNTATLFADPLETPCDKCPTIAHHGDELIGEPLKPYDCRHRCPHLLGNIVLDVPHTGLVKLGVDIDDLKPEVSAEDAAEEEELKAAITDAPLLLQPVEGGASPVCFSVVESVSLGYVPKERMEEPAGLGKVLLISNWPDKYRCLDFTGLTNLEVVHRIQTFYKHKTIRRMIGDHTEFEGFEPHTDETGEKMHRIYLGS